MGEKQNQPMRIVVSAPLWYGGVTSLMLNLQKNMDRDLLNFDYLVFHDEEAPRAGTVKAMGSRIIVASVDWMPVKLFRGVLRIFVLAKVCRENNVKILHVNSGDPVNVVKALAARLGGVKYITYHSHSSASEHPSTVQRIVEAVSRRLIPLVANDMWACSDLAAQFTFPKSVVDQKKYYYMPNGIDLAKYAYNADIRQKVREEMGWDNHFVVSLAGRFSQEKNHEFLIDIFSEIAERDDSALLALFGVGALQEKIKEKVRSMHLEDKVHFYGGSDRMEQMYQGMDVFVMPSKFEGLPVAGVESQAAGLPTVFSDVITRQVAVSRNVEYISLQESAAVWAEKILAFRNAERKDCCKELRAAGFDQKEMVSHFQKYYLDVGKKLGLIES